METQLIHANLEILADIMKSFSQAELQGHKEVNIVREKVCKFCVRYWRVHDLLVVHHSNVKFIQDHSALTNPTVELHCILLTLTLLL